MGSDQPVGQLGNIDKLGGRERSLLFACQSENLTSEPLEEYQLADYSVVTAENCLDVAGGLPDTARQPHRYPWT